MPSSAASPWNLAAWLLALPLAAAIGYADLRLEELLLTAVLVLAAAMAAGTLLPQRPWRCALLFGLAVPLAHLLMRVTAWMWVDPARLPAAFALLLVSFVGAYAGAFFRHAASRLLEKS